jgi:parallel beta-helix repeat protein
MILRGCSFISFFLFLTACSSQKSLSDNVDFPISLDTEGGAILENATFQTLYKSGKRVFYFRNPTKDKFVYKTFGIELFDGITIKTDANVWFEPIVKSNGKPVYVKGLFGIKGNNVVLNQVNIDGRQKACLGIAISGNQSVVQNSEIKNLSTEGGNPAFGIQVFHGSQNVRIVDNYIHSIKDVHTPSQPIRAVQVGKVLNINVENNVIDNLSSQFRAADIDAIHVQAGTDTDFGDASGSIKNNLFYNTQKRAIKIHANDFEVTGNIIRSVDETEYAVYAAISIFGRNTKVLDNDIQLTRGLIGISLAGHQGKSSFNLIANNRILIDTVSKFYGLSQWGSLSDTAQIGIDIISGAHDNTVRDNYISTPTTGIKLGESHKNSVSNNLITKSRFPIWLQNSSDIRLENNAYLDNKNEWQSDFTERRINCQNITSKKASVNERGIKEKIDKQTRQSQSVLKEETAVPRSYNAVQTINPPKRKVKIYIPSSQKVFNSEESFQKYRNQLSPEKRQLTYFIIFTPPQ